MIPQKDPPLYGLCLDFTRALVSSNERKTLLLRCVQRM